MRKIRETIMNHTIIYMKQYILVQNTYTSRFHGIFSKSGDSTFSKYTKFRNFHTAVNLLFYIVPTTKQKF